MAGQRHRPCECPTRFSPFQSKTPFMSEPPHPSQKVGVLTFHRCINYGCYWQARCLSKALQGRGFDVALLDHRARRVDIAEWRCAFRPQLPHAPNPADYPALRRKIEAFHDAFEQLPLSPSFDLDQPENVEEHDAVVVGSDEVWNLSHPWYGKKTLFWGDHIRAKKLISYAASFGNQTHDIDEFWADKLRRFDAMSVRDANSQRIIERALGFAPPLVLDPALQWQITPEGEERGPDAPFVAVYGHDFSPQFAAHARRYAQAQGLPLVSIGYRNGWAHQQWLDAGPHDFARFISRAQGVVTNFFHGCVFALANSKPFATEVSDYRAVKISNLMQTVGAERHLTDAQTSEDAFDALLGEPLNARIGARLGELRKFSERYLDEALDMI